MSGHFQVIVNNLGDGSSNHCIFTFLFLTTHEYNHFKIKMAEIIKIPQTHSHNIITRDHPTPLAINNLNKNKYY